MTDDRQSGTLYCMVMPGHICPYGLKSQWQLECHGYAVDDHWLRTREETDAFKAEHGVRTTAQTFIGGKRIGENDDLTRFLGGHVLTKDEMSYRPVVAVFAMTALMAMAASLAMFGTPLTVRAGEWFVAMCVLALPVALFIREIGAYSVFKAVYVKRRNLKRACVDEPSNVPLGFVSLTENIAMVAMALWLLAR